MSGDSYQAIYDAVRSKISGGSISDAVESAVRSSEIGWHAQQIAETIKAAVSLYEEPSVLYRPSLSVDGNQWCALYGENLQSGVAGFGDSPYLAMVNFNKNWYAKLPTKAEAA
jgi:hypothetical protein